MYCGFIYNNQEVKTAQIASIVDGVNYGMVYTAQWSTPMRTVRDMDESHQRKFGQKMTNKKVYTVNDSFL